MEEGILDRADRLAGQNRLAAVLTYWRTGVLVKDVTPAAVAIVDVVDVERARATTMALDESVPILDADRVATHPWSPSAGQNT